MSSTQDAADARDATVASAVKEVIVYESSAQIHRHCTTVIPKGTSRLVFEDLPSDLDKDSLQVALALSHGTPADARIVLRGISFDQITKTVAPSTTAGLDEQRAADARELKELEGQLADKRNEIAIVKSMSAVNDKMFAKATNPSLEKDDMDRVLDVAMWETVVSQYTATFEKHFAAIRRLEKEAEALLEAMTVVRNRSARSCASTMTVAKNVVAVGLTANQEVPEVLVALSYVVRNAGWTAEYDVRFSGATQGLTLQYNAVVWQKTSEAWTDVKLTLSTARPALSGKQPELAPWRVAVYVPQPSVRSHRSHAKSKPNKSCMARNEEAIAYDNDSDDNERAYGAALEDFTAPAVEEADVAESASSTSVSFTVPQLATLAPSGDPQRMTLVQLPMQALVSHVTVPSKVPAAFARAKIKNGSQFVLVTGPVNVFVDNQLVTTSSIGRVGPTEEFSLSLGRDESIAVTNKLLAKKRDSESAGLFAGRTDLVKYSYMTTIKNNKKVPVTITLQERIPVSSDSVLVVDLVAPPVAALSKAQRAKMDETGQVDVELTLAAGELVDAPFAFNVKAPEGRTVYGL